MTEPLARITPLGLCTTGHARHRLTAINRARNCRRPVCVEFFGTTSDALRNCECWAFQSRQLARPFHETRRQAELASLACYKNGFTAFTPAIISAVFKSSL